LEEGGIKMKYEIKYVSIWREKEAIVCTKEIEASSDSEAIEIARKFVGEFNSRKNTLEKFKLRGVIRIDQEKKTTKVL